MSQTAVDSFRLAIVAHCKGRQEQVAKEAGISRVFLNKILQGHSEPSLETAAKIATALNISLDEAITSASK